MNLASNVRLSLSDLQQQVPSFSRERQHLTLITALLGATITLVLNLTVSKAIWEKGKASGVAPSTTRSHPVPLKLLLLFSSQQLPICSHKTAKSVFFFSRELIGCAALKTS